MSDATNELSAERIRERRTATVKAAEFFRQWHVVVRMPHSTEREREIERLNAEHESIYELRYGIGHDYAPEVDALLAEVARLQRERDELLVLAKGLDAALEAEGITDVIAQLRLSKFCDESEGT